MCMICADLARNALTSKEARRNLNEYVIGREFDGSEREHIQEVLEEIEHLETLEKSSTM